MPKRKKAKWGHRSRYLLTVDDGVQVYSEDAIRELASKYGMGDAQRLAELKDRLESAGVVYRTYRLNHNDAPRAGEMKVALDEVQALTEALHSRLEQLDDVTANFFWWPEIELQLMIMDRTLTESRYGHKIDRYSDGEDGEIVSHLDQSDLFEALEIIRNYAADAKTRLPVDKGGRARDLALRIWLVNAKRIWEDLFGQKFTLDYHEGRPASDASQFCLDAFRFVNADVQPRNIVSGMKALMKENSKRRTGKNPSKN